MSSAVDDDFFPPPPPAGAGAGDGAEDAGEDLPPPPPPEEEEEEEEALPPPPVGGAAATAAAPAPAPAPFRVGGGSVSLGGGAGAVPPSPASKSLQFVRPSSWSDSEAEGDDDLPAPPLPSTAEEGAADSDEDSDDSGDGNARTNGGGASSDSDADSPVMPPPSLVPPPSRDLPLPVPAPAPGMNKLHIRRKSALHVFGSESAQSFADLQSRLHAGPNGTTISSPLSAAVEPVPPPHASPVSPPSTTNTNTNAHTSSALSSPSSPSLMPSSPPAHHLEGRPASGSISTSSSGTYPAVGTPVSRSSISMSAAHSPLSPAGPGSLTPILQRRGSDFRQRLGSQPLLSSALFTALSPSSTTSSIGGTGGVGGGLGSHSATGTRRTCQLQGCNSFASRNGFCLRHVWKLSVEELEPLNAKQYQVAKELVSTERSYCDSLRVIYKSFVLRLQVQSEMEGGSAGGGRALLDPADMGRVFHNVEDIFKLSEQLSADLEEITLEKVLTTAVGSTLLHYAPLFRIYQSYLENYDDAVRVLTQLRKDKPDFDFFCKLQEKCEGLSLESFLIMPVQRLPRYLLLLGELIKRSQEASSSSASLDGSDGSGGLQGAALADMIAARDRISAIATAINASLHQKENQLKVAAIQACFERDARYQDLVTPTRYLIREGPLKKRYGKGTRHLTGSTVYHFFLFSDILVYADASKNVLGKGVTYRLKHILPLAEMTVEPTSSARTGKDKDLLVTTRNPAGSKETKDDKSSSKEKAFELGCADTAERDAWLLAFRQAIGQLQEDQRNLRSATFDGSNVAQGDGKGTIKSSKLKQMMGV